MTSSDLVDFHVHLGPQSRHNPDHKIKVDIQNVNFWYGTKQALNEVSLKIYEKEVVAFIGPSGCGKTTLLRCLNRSNEIIPNTRLEGSIFLSGENIYGPDVDPPMLRRRFGWVAQKPNPFPWSIYENVAYGPKIHGLVHTRAETNDMVEMCLQRVGLWDEVKDRLKQSGTELSGGQQQRLCVARAIATNPEVILMDEPASALDPNSTLKLERLVEELRNKYTIVIITHNMQQAARISQRVAVFHLGRLVEQGDAVDTFTDPKHDISQAYINGYFG